MPGRALPRRINAFGAAVTIIIAIGGCAPASAVTPPPSSSPSPSPTPTQASPSPGPTQTPGADPAFVPALSAIQMVGSRLGWALGSHAIFGTHDGTHWATLLTSTEEFVGVDFINATTGWAVGARSLLGTTDAGRTWRALGEATQPIRSVHFISPLAGWGVAGGADPASLHGWLIPTDGATLVVTGDGGLTWAALDGPDNPQTVCFSDAAQGWVGTRDGVYRFTNTAQGQSWAKARQRPDGAVPESAATLVQCAAPHAVWALFIGGAAAAGHSPYRVDASVDGSSWRAVLNEPMTSTEPSVPAGPDSHPPSFSVVDPADAVFIGDGPATNVAQCLIATNGGATLRRTGRIDNAPETFAAAFTSTTTGWVLTRNAGGDYVIDATTDAGNHWVQQLAIPPTSAG
jgi:hypothetical protein